MYQYNFREFKKDVNVLTKEIQKNIQVDAIVAISRGGFTLAHFLATKLDCRMLFCINAIGYDNTQKLETIEIFNIPDLSGFGNILIVDDIVDSGRTIEQVKQILSCKYDARFFVASIYHKKSACIAPDFYLKEANEWIEFFWEKK